MKYMLIKIIFLFCLGLFLQKTMDNKVIHIGPAKQYNINLIQWRKYIISLFKRWEEFYCIVS